MNRTNKTTKKRLGIPILDNTKTGVCNQKAWPQSMSWDSHLSRFIYKTPHEKVDSHSDQDHLGYLSK